MSGLNISSSVLASFARCLKKQVTVDFHFNLPRDSEKVLYS